MTVRRSSWWVSSLASWWLVVGLAAAASVSAAASSAAAADGPEGRLLGRVPAGASLVVELSDLGGHLDGMAESRLVGGLAGLGVVREWLDSDEGAKLRKARREIEAALAAPMGEVVRGLLGEQVVLSLHLPDDAPPDEARGLLQTSVRDRDLLERFITVGNAAEQASGALQNLAMARHGEVNYTLRIFKDGRPDEAYVLLEDDTFVWTNSERLLQGVVDRVERGGLAAWRDDPAVARVREGLPDRAMVSVFVDADFIARLAEADPAGSPIEGLPAPLVEALGAIDVLGLALEWREGLVLHAVEAIDPDRLPAPIRSWAARRGEGGPSALLSRVPEPALLAAAGHVDATALHDLLVASVSEGRRDRLDTAMEVMQGLMFGRDLRGEILPTLGPEVVGWVDTPPADRPLRKAPVVLATSIGDPAAAEALGNALRTVLGFFSLDEDRKPPLRLVHEAREGVRISALVSGANANANGSTGAGSTWVAFGVARGMIVVGTDVDAVASTFSDRSAGASDRLPPVLATRDRHFPDASTFVSIDLVALNRLAVERREELERLVSPRPSGDDDSGPSAREDLGLLFELLPLFKAAYVTTSLAPDATMARQRIGLVVAD